MLAVLAEPVGLWGMCRVLMERQFHMGQTPELQFQEERHPLGDGHGRERGWHSLGLHPSLQQASHVVEAHAGSSQPQVRTVAAEPGDALDPTPAPPSTPAATRAASPTTPRGSEFSWRDGCGAQIKIVEKIVRVPVPVPVPVASGADDFRYWERTTSLRDVFPRPTDTASEKFISFEPWNGGFNNIRQVHLRPYTPVFPPIHWERTTNVPPPGVCWLLFTRAWRSRRR